MKYIHSNSECLFAFNIWDVNSAKSIIDAASKFRKNVILQTSSRIFISLDKTEFYYYVKSYAKKKQVQVHFHLDHCRDFKIICEAISCKWDSVMIDGSHLNLEENIKMTNEICNIAHRKNILVEAEVGQIKGTEDSIKVEDQVAADINEIQVFLQSTNIDLFAAAVGTAHGLYSGVPKIQYDVIGKIKEMSSVPFVIHGGTGLSDHILKKLLSYENVKKINISTDVKQSYRKGLLNACQKKMLEEKGFEAIRIEKCIHDEIMDMAEKKLHLLL